jgi:hypothetical protein
MFSSKDFATDCSFMAAPERAKALSRVLRAHGCSTLTGADHETIDVVDADGECITLANDADEVLGWLGY